MTQCATGMPAGPRLRYDHVIRLATKQGPTLMQALGLHAAEPCLPLTVRDASFVSEGVKRVNRLS